MAATGVQLNFASVSFAGTPVTRVTSLTFSQGGSLISFAGDNARYAQVVANNMNNPSCTITSGDVATLYNFNAGSQGTILGTQIDALAASGGNIIWTGINAVHGNTDNSAPFSQFATATATFQHYSADGSTNPVSFSRA